MVRRHILAGLAAATLMVTSFGVGSSVSNAQGITPESVQRSKDALRQRPAPAPAAQPQRPSRPVVQAPAPQQRVAPSRPAPQQQARRSGGGNGGRNLAIGIGAAVLGGVILSEAARADRRNRPVFVEESYEDDDDRRQRCADRFRSFDWDDGTFINRDGDRVMCPFLR
jgi:BA14K-like protein